MAASPVGDARSLGARWRPARPRLPIAVLAIDEDGRTFTGREFRDAAERAAAGLLAHGVGPDVNVSWMLPTWLESAVLVAALARLGAVQNPMLPILGPREMRFIVGQTGASLLIVPSEWRGRAYADEAREIAKDQPGLEVLVADRELPDGDPSVLPPPPAPTNAADAPVRWVFYTSGTTADPKGARHTDLHGEGIGDRHDRGARGHRCRSRGDGVPVHPHRRHRLAVHDADHGMRVHLRGGVRAGRRPSRCCSASA